MSFSKTVHIIGGGTVYHVRPHLALSAVAYGGTARKMAELISLYENCDVNLHLTKMAGGNTLETAEDISELVDRIMDDPNTSAIFMPVAICDFQGNIVDPEGTITKSGKDQPRLKTSEGMQSMVLTPEEKIIKKIRKTRKDIFLVGFKTTAGFNEDDQFLSGLKMLKDNSCNLVFSNDIQTRKNMIITPEQARYDATSDRLSAISTLINISNSRCGLKFTRSSIIEGDLIPWNSELIHESLRTVVNHCISKGAYRPFNGKTVGHFAMKVGENKFLTSVRKSNFNNLEEEGNGLVLIESEGLNRVLAFGARPSVGGQSQRIIFTDHPELDSIVHFHCPIKPGSEVPVAKQWPYECGSHECGMNTSRNLKNFDGIHAVMLDNHGPNIVFNHSVDPQKVIQFIEDNFDLNKSTDGVLYKRARTENLQIQI